LGVLLPYTPLHHLLFHDLAGLPLVMTSGNRADEPMATDDAAARDSLAGIADGFLTHDRPIHLRCDDGVTRIVAGLELPVRRARGDAPQPLPLPVPCQRPLLAVGGHLKAAFALGRGGQAVLSHHLGDLDHLDAYRAFEAAVDHYERLFTVHPEGLIHDAHPDYASTRYALQRATAEGLPCLAVQHHEAHVASCLADNGGTGPVIGIAFDGSGFGADGAVWGGEFLTGGLEGFCRAARLRYVPLPGGDRAVREPWRMAVAHLRDAGLGYDQLFPFAGPAAVQLVDRGLAIGILGPPTSSMGRLFDAVAALAGVCGRVSFEGQAAIALEGLAAAAPPDDDYPFELATDG
jgi:hydrogenase maturation protein HypF